MSQTLRCLVSGAVKVLYVRRPEQNRGVKPQSNRFARSICVHLCASVVPFSCRDALCLGQTARNWNHRCTPVHTDGSCRCKRHRQLTGATSIPIDDFSHQCPVHNHQSTVRSQNQAAQVQLRPLSACFSHCRIGDRQAAHVAAADIRGGCAGQRAFAVRRVPRRQRVRLRRAQHCHRRIGRAQRRRGQLFRTWIGRIAGDNHRGGFFEQVGGGQDAGHAGDALDVGERTQRGLGMCMPRGVAGQVEQTGEDLGDDARARGSGVVRGGARTRQRHVSRVVGRGVEPTVPISEFCLRRAHDAFGLRQPRRIAGRLEQRQGRAGHRGLVVQQAHGGNASEPPGVLHPPIGRAHFRQHEIEGFLGAGQPLGMVEHGRGAGQRGDRQAVPIRQHLVVAAGTDPLRPRPEQYAARAGECGFLGGRTLRGDAAQDRVAFPIAGRRHVVGALERGRIGTQQRVDFRLGPDVEFSFLALAVGILRRGEGGAAGHALRGHVARHPRHRFGSARGVERRGTMRVRQRQQVEQLCIVVHHLLEMRHQPDRIGRIPRIAAAEMVVDAALRHPFQHQVQRILAGRIAGAERILPEEPEDRRIGKFRRSLQPAMLSVVQAQIGLRHRVEMRRGRQVAGLRLGLRLQIAPQRAGVLGHHLVALAIRRGDALQHLAERWAAPAGLRREIRAAPERRAVRCEEHRQRPAALLAQRVQRGHVEVVDVGTFLAIHLDVDEQRVHQRGGLRVLEGFVRHDVAPVAGGVADRQHDRLVGLGRLAERGRAPGPPVHRVVGVLEQVGRGLVAEQVGVLWHGAGPSAAVLGETWGQERGADKSEGRSGAPDGYRRKAFRRLLEALERSRPSRYKGCIERRDIIRVWRRSGRRGRRQGHCRYERPDDFETVLVSLQMPPSCRWNSRVASRVVGTAPATADSPHILPATDSWRVQSEWIRQLSAQRIGQLRLDAVGRRPFLRGR